MSMTMESVVQAVEPRKVTVQGVERTVYDIVDASQVKWTAWERELAEQAFALKGQPSVWSVEQKPNTRRPEFPYRNLKGIVAKGSSSMDAALSSGFPESAPAVTTFDAPATTTDTYIHRQVAVKATCVLAGAGGMTPDEFWNNVKALLTFIETGQAPNDQGNAGNATSTFTGPMADDDIPF